MLRKVPKKGGGERTLTNGSNIDTFSLHTFPRTTYHHHPTEDRVNLKQVVIRNPSDEDGIFLQPFYTLHIFSVCIGWRGTIKRNSRRRSGRKVKGFSFPVLKDRLKISETTELKQGLSYLYLRLNFCLLTRNTCQRCSFSEFSWKRLWTESFLRVTPSLPPTWGRTFLLKVNETFTLKDSFK